MRSTQKTWTQEARNVLKALLVRQNISQEELAKKLNAIGIEESVAGIRGKLHRGTFSFAFVLQVMRALDKSVLRVE